MKLQFDANLEYQDQAISSVVDLFKGQSTRQNNFTVSAYSDQVGLFDNTNGMGNRLELDYEEILVNLNEIQLRNGLEQTKVLRTLDFDVEMETGTGKTYVYLRTILELHQKYGFSKFIIVVPSLPIKEGVNKSLNITKDHFANLYDNVQSDYFVYDSNKLEQIRNYAISDHISIIVINIDAFRKSFTDPTKENKANIIHRSNDKLNGMRPIELIQETNPIVIIDEPQSVDTTPKSKEAIMSLNPLCTLRYSATHVEKHNLVYKLDAIDSFDLGLVKQIEVAGFVSKDYHNNAYIKLISVNNKKRPITAKIEIDINVKGLVKRKIVSVRKGHDLYERSGGRDTYEGYIIEEIYCEEGNEYISFTSKQDIIYLGKSIGDIDEDVIKEQQIKKTIEEHLDKELILNPKGIKVLSLFFIDRVANYRYYDKDGNICKGKYSEMFERNYAALINKPKYSVLRKSMKIDASPSDVHNGYFSQDKKGAYKDTSGTTNKDEDAYSLIMTDKEKLLSFNTKLRFIFSHSALREGWDNPNVFQICTLNETNSEIKKRQEIGRGLRLCVDQSGNRIFGNDINILTVMANESYESFADKLQKEYEKEEGIRFGILEKHTFANIIVKDHTGNSSYLGQEMSETLFHFFEVKGYIDSKGNVQDKLKNALKHNLLEVPESAASITSLISTICKKICGSINIKNSDDKRKIELNKQVYLSPEFKALWERIKFKTTYAVDFDSNLLIDNCCQEINKQLVVSSAKLIYSKAKLIVNQGGVDVTETEHISVSAANVKEQLPDIITHLQNGTNLTRKTIVNILIKSNTLNLFKKNPQRYMEETAKIIKSVMKLMIVDGIKYTKLGEDQYFAQELFENRELTGYLRKNMMESQKSVYQYVVYDSSNEENFAMSFENNKSVKLYTKLPDWFRIPTPLGSYNPDWAVLIEMEGKEKLYFVLETKGNTMTEALRPTESAKIACGHKHFEALGNEAHFEEISDFMDLIESDKMTPIG